MFKVGFSKIDLYSSLTQEMPVREPIEAISAYFEFNEEKCLWIVLDFMDFNKSITDKIKNAISKSIGLSQSLIHVLTTHNHGGGTPEPELLSSLCAECAANAVNSSKESILRYAFTRSEKQVNIIRRLYVKEAEGVGTLYFGASESNEFNSSLFAENFVNGLLSGEERNSIAKSTSRPYSKFRSGDDEMLVIEFRDTFDKPIGSIVRFAAHAVTANRGDSYSSDYPYHVRKKLEDELGGISMFLNGPCGEIAPAIVDKFEGGEERIGKYLASLATEAIKKEDFKRVEVFLDLKKEVKLPVREEVINNEVVLEDNMPEELPKRRKHLERMRLKRTLSFLREKYTEGEEKTGEFISVFLGALRINELVILAFPGETFYYTGNAVKEHHKNRQIATVTEHERTVMYLPPKEDDSLGGYESVCRVTSADAEKILRSEAINLIYKIYEERK